MLRCRILDLPLLLVGIGVILSIASFFLGQKSNIDAEEIEKISISLHEETNGLKKRIKVLEEELMMSMEPFDVTDKAPARQEPIHEIIVNQILSLHSQGFSIDDIAKRSSLSNAEVLHVLQTRGVR